ncbi:recombinase family protein [Bacteroidota bacterium]
MKAAIYCRVSTEDQEREGSSLQSQLEACKKLALDQGYEVPEGFTIMETYSGLSLDRPKLNEVRQWVRDKEVDVVIAYTLDRLSRDPVHFIILQEELERVGVALLMVTEDLDSSDMGKLISYIKGFAAKLEAEKIRERTMRGARTKALAGKFPSGHRARLFGYSYQPDIGKRLANEEQAYVVRQIFHYFVNDGMGVEAIALKLRALGIPTPSGKGLWQTRSVWEILRNPAYIGETYAFTQTYVEPNKRTKKNPIHKKTHKVIRPKEEWISIPDVTPAIIDRQTFESAQARLKLNRERAGRNRKHEYLLSGHIRCQRCGRNYHGFSRLVNSGGRKCTFLYYQCPGNRQTVTPIKCGNHNLNAEKIESTIWEEVERVLQNPELIVAYLQTDSNEIDLWEDEFTQIDRRLTEIDRDQQQLLQWAVKGFPEETVVKENEKMNEHRNQLLVRKDELKGKIEHIRQTDIDTTSIEKFCQIARGNLKDFTFENKRLALDMLQVQVVVDGDEISLSGAIPIGDVEFALPY